MCDFRFCLHAKYPLTDRCILCVPLMRSFWISRNLKHYSKRIP